MIERAFVRHDGLFAEEEIFSTPLVLWAFLAQVLRGGKGAACAAAVADNQVTTTCPVTGSVVSAYDEAGNLTLRTDQVGVTVHSDYDEVNRLVLRHDGGASTASYAYDALGRLITAEKGSSGNPDAVSRSVFSFNPLSRLLSEKARRPGQLGPGMATSRRGTSPPAVIGSSPIGPIGAPSSSAASC